MENRKVVIIGSGAVGSTTAYTMMLTKALMKSLL